MSKYLCEVPYFICVQVRERVYSNLVAIFYVLERSLYVVVATIQLVGFVRFRVGTNKRSTRSMKFV